MPDQQLDKYLTENADRFTRELQELLRIPSISTDPARKDAMLQTAEFVRDSLARLGFESSVRPTDLHPVVYGELISDPALPTLLVYGHYDVQPPEPLELWETDPFDPVIRDGKIWARGASDDKGQFFAHIKGVEAALASRGKLPVNLKFLIEGEEEIGSPNLDDYVRDHAEELKADAVVVSDGAMVGPGVPTLTRSLRGLSYIEVRIRTAARDLHSGAYGGAVPNAIHVLSRMLSQLHDENGRITVPGFYDDVKELDDADRELLAKVPFDQDRFLDQVGVKTSVGEAGRSVLERISTRPTLDVNGIGGGFQGEGSKTVIPSTAMAKISCRLVANQDSGKVMDQLEQYLKDLAPAGTQVEVIRLGAAQPASTPAGFPALEAAANALREVWGREAVHARTGGTIPVVNTFQQLLGAPVVLLDMGLETDNLHAPNEHFSVDGYQRGIHAAALLYANYQQD